MIIRVERNSRHRFTIIDNITIEDAGLSWETLGLLVWLLSKPDGWHVTRDGIISQRKTSTERLTRIMKELEENGYLTRHRGQHPTGGFLWENVVHERPIQRTASSENPTMTSPINPIAASSGNPSSGKASSGNPPLLNTDRVKTDLPKTEHTQNGDNPFLRPKINPLTDFDQFWELYPRKQDKEAARKSWAKLLKEKDYASLKLKILARVKTAVLIDWSLTPKEKIPHPSTWLNNRRWEDEVIEPSPLRNGNGYHQSEENPAYDKIKRDEERFEAIARRGINR